MSVQMERSIDSGMPVSGHTVALAEHVYAARKPLQFEALAVREIGCHRGPRLGRQAFPSCHNPRREPVRHGVPGRFRNPHTLVSARFKVVSCLISSAIEGGPDALATQSAGPEVTRRRHSRLTQGKRFSKSSAPPGAKHFTHSG
jgi:hypothetical protein